MAGVLERHYEQLPGAWLGIANSLAYLAHKTRVLIDLHLGELELHASLKGLEMQHIRLGVSRLKHRGWIHPSLGGGIAITSGFERFFLEKPRLGLSYQCRTA